MSLLDKASLIVTPNAYKESKLYSVVPNTTLGDMDVVRATTATRVNSAGLIEVVPRNLLTYSEQFDNAAWTKSNLTVTANAAIAPNGTMTAEKIIGTAINATHIALQQISFPTNTIATCSIYAKAAELSFLYVGGLGRTPSANEGYVFFNLSNGTVGVSDAGYTGSMSNEGNGWYKLTVNAPIMATSTLREFRIGVTNTNGVQSYLGDGTSGVFVWGAQLETGSQTEYFPTTTRLNIPRIDYTNGSCPSLLVEPQRTNLVLRSEEFNISPWSTLSVVTITANATTSPSGNLTADLILGADASSSVNQIIAGTTGVVYTNSFYIKNNNSTQSRLTIRNTITAVECNINWTGSELSGITNLTGTSTFQSVGNGWYRIISTYTAAEAAQRPRILPTLTTNQSVYVWGAQLELGSYPTSYIPTVASTVTRNADVISNNNLISKGLIVNDYVLFVDITNPILGSQYIFDSTDISSIRTGILRVDGTTASITDITGGSTISILNILTIGKGKMCVKRTGSNISFFANGVKAATTTTTTAGTINNLKTGVINSKNSSYINTFLLFSTALTDTECINLTTL